MAQHTAQIVPTIMAETPSELAEAIAKLRPFARRVHIDLADGVFAPRTLIEPSQLTWPAEWHVDIHVMAARPSQWLDALIAKKPQSIILHAEADEDIVPLLEKIKSARITPGVALLKPTAPSTCKHALQSADHAMIFSGDLGKFGGTASMLQLQKVRLIRQIHPMIEIGWDGGVNIHNVAQLAHGGVTVLNAGGAISGAANPQAAYNSLATTAKARPTLSH